ncbi:hypothetical protein SAMN05444671_2341 [Flavobacterium sp. CF108]|uniref:hypothetical protein n=1 Tax=unclassified Flavobacterium TaxID=196869 RepID=UPI0008B866E7|nr:MULTISPECIES: hypothetical protein [unclassified Flavobacterium]SEN88192.1 hypothetical protein SAMN04487978_1657 [Flavobacterium sp. fv08]SHH23334.1 hypothetical protein SAMN05444671_2341 [Flavobacterium sp. CF108]
MDLDTRKVIFIRDFLKLESEKAISQFEKLLKKETKMDSELKPMSITDFQKRIDDSMSDSKNGRLTESDKLISEIEKWS